MSAVSTGLRMALLQSGADVEVSTVAPDLAKVTAADHLDATLAEAAEQSSRGSAGQMSAPRGGGG